MFKKSLSLAIIFLIAISSISSISAQTNGHECACIVDFYWHGDLSKEVYILSHNNYKVYQDHNIGSIVGGFELQNGQTYLQIHLKEWYIANIFIPFIVYPEYRTYHIHGIDLSQDHRIEIWSGQFREFELYFDGVRIPEGKEVYL
ncbi:MAG: hypothetical protein LBD03_01065 [Methanobrevibacter sp.]|jgi:hypothetical protein|nr:hypothetical protein [Candidatus Methanovirga procula]